MTIKDRIIQLIEEHPDVVAEMLTERCNNGDRITEHAIGAGHSCNTCPYNTGGECDPTILEEEL